MIAIVNITSNSGLNAEVHRYQLRINDKVIGRFTHRRSLGLGECLRKAAECADEATIKKMTELVESGKEVRFEV